MPMFHRRLPLFLWPMIVIVAATAATPPTTAPAADPVLPTLTPTMADLDLSTPEKACVSHWKTWFVTDMDLIRAQTYAANRTESQALTVAAGYTSAQNRNQLAIIKQFGKDAFSNKDVLTPPPDRSVFESIRWQVTGDRAVPINPPDGTLERPMVRVDGKWLVPVSEIICIDQRRLAEMVTETKSTREQTTLILSGAFKTVSAITQPTDLAPAPPPDPAAPHAPLPPPAAPVSIWTPTTQSTAVVLPPGSLPDTNDTLPAGAVAGFAMAVFNGDGRSAAGFLTADTDPEKAAISSFVKLTDENAKLFKAVDAGFDQTPHTAEQVPYVAVLKTLSAAVLQNVGDISQVTIAPDGKTAVVHVTSSDLTAPAGMSDPTAFSCDVRFDLVKDGDHWKISTAKLLQRFVPDDAHRDAQIKKLAAVIDETAADQSAMTADIAAGKYTSVDQLQSDATDRMDSLKSKYDGLLVKPAETK